MSIQRGRPSEVAGPASRPVPQIIGLHIVVLGLTMLIPFALDLADGNANAEGIAIAAILTIVAGLGLSAATWQSSPGGLGRSQAIVLTVAVWALLPAFGGLPLMTGAPHLSFTDAYFESMSGFTTTGSTVISGLDHLPRGALLWRAMLQWFGGLGIVIVAIVFLPVMRIGGMQFFHAVGMDISGETIPRATQIAEDLLRVYLALTIGCALGYAAAGMSVFDAICYSFSTIATGGYGNHDDSFAGFSIPAHYVSIVFMLLSGMPFIRFVELGRGRPRPLWRDSQIRAFLAIVAVASGLVALPRIWQGVPLEPAIRLALFNVTSIISTTGYASGDYGQWGGLVGAVMLFIALCGACSGSTSGAAKVFRFQILISALAGQIRRIRSPHSVHLLRYQGKQVQPDVLSSIMAFMFIYFVTVGIVAILLSLMGLDFLTAISAPAATQTNVGPGLGPIIGPAGNFAPLPGAAKWLLSLDMLLGRLEFLSVLVLLSPAFWR